MCRRLRSRSRIHPGAPARRRGSWPTRPRLAADLLAMAEVAGIVIRHLARRSMLAAESAPGRTRNSEMSFTLAANQLPVVHPVGKDMCIVLEHGPAAGGIDDDRRRLRPSQMRPCSLGQFERRPFDAGVVMDRPAADLAAGDQDFAAVLLQHAGGGRVGLGEHGVGHAAEEQGHPGALGANRRQDLRQSRPRLESFGSMACIRRKVGGRSRIRPLRSARSRTPSRCSQPRRCERRSTRPDRGTGGGGSAARARLAFSFTLGRACAVRSRTARSSGRTGRPKGKPTRRPGNPGTVPGARDARAHRQAAIGDGRIR